MNVPKALLAIVALSLQPAVAESPAGATEFERLNTSSGNLATIAGTGLVDVEGANSWIPDYEGANPRTVELSNPHMTTADAFGRLYIADKESHAILRISVDRTSIITVAGTHVAGNGADAEASATTVAISNPNGLFTLPDGTTYILDLDNGKIRRLDMSTGTMRTIVTDPAGFGAGRGLWVSPDESLIYYCGGASGVGANQNVRKWTPAGGIETFASVPGDLGNLTVDPNGHVVVTSRAQHRVYRVSLDGLSITPIAGNGSTSTAVSGQPALSIGMERVRGVAFRPDGSYFLCSQKGADVLFVDTSGIAHIYVTGASNGNSNSGDGQPPSAPGPTKISEPRAITLAPNGDLIITTNDTGFIRAVHTLCPPAPPSLSETTLTLADNSLTLTFPPVYNTPYFIDQSPDLTPDSWAPVAITLTGNATLPAVGTAFLRIRAPR
jgi:streptogramin lyase